MAGQLRKGIKTQVLNLDKRKCVRCGDHETLTIDHIVPRSKGGSNVVGNLQTLCRECNEFKGSRTMLFTRRPAAVRYFVEYSIRLPLDREERVMGLENEIKELRKAVIALTTAMATPTINITLEQEPAQDEALEKDLDEIAREIEAQAEVTKDVTKEAKTKQKVSKAKESKKEPVSKKVSVEAQPDADEKEKRKKLSAALRKVSGALGGEKVKGLLQSFNYSRLSEVKLEDVGALTEAATLFLGKEDE